MYCHSQLVNGLIPTPFKRITPKWFAGWEAEFGLSLRRPNRKFKVPLAVMEERCVIFWLSIFKVRAACEALHGYDPGIENFDQSPYYHNETGSKNVSTVAVAGMVCPLVEGHADTRERIDRERAGHRRLHAGCTVRAWAALALVDIIGASAANLS